MLVTESGGATNPKSVFTLIIEGTLPAHFVYRDDVCVAFMSIAPLASGHTLVVPTASVDHWIDLDAETISHVMNVSKVIGSAIDAAYQPTKVGMMIAGLEVPHVHVHLVPIDSATDMDFGNAKEASQEDLAAAAAAIKAHLPR